ncbi:MAG: hypothetical protein U0L20_01420 [Ruminococcus sp.]|nr:hypothetical protein [Ruminococcus sp.]
MSTNTINRDTQYYNDALKHIKENNLDKALYYIDKIQSNNLKDELLSLNNNIINNLNENTKLTGYYQGCDGNWHDYDDSSSSGGGSGGEDGECCGFFFCIIFTICCSSSIHECCWCSLCDLITDIIDFCT